MSNFEYDEKYDNIEKAKNRCRSSYEDIMYQKSALLNYFEKINFYDKDVNFQNYFEEEYNRMKEYSKQMNDIDNSLDDEVNSEKQFIKEMGEKKEEDSIDG